MQAICEVSGKLLPSVASWPRWTPLTAAGGPEANHDRAGAREHLGLERVVRDVSHVRPNLSSGTRQIASSTIRRLILEAPCVRSSNVIGSSTTEKPARLAR